MATLYIMVGLPGSGKSTKAKKIANETGAIITSLDSMREEIAGSRKNWHENPDIFNNIMSRSIANIQNAMVEWHLKNGESVIVDNMNLKSRYVAFFQELSKKYGTNIEFVKMKCDWVTLKERNQSRPSDERVDEDWLYQMFKTYRHIIGR